MSQFHFTPADYLDLMRSELPAFDELQEAVAAATEGLTVARILELGTGTGETARRVLESHPAARLTGIDVSAEMLAAARAVLASDRIDELLVRDIAAKLPAGPFDLAISALAVHHLGGPAKAQLFRRVADVLRPGGRFVMGDVIVPIDPADAVTPLSPDYDLRSAKADLLAWLQRAGFAPHTTWEKNDLVVLVADRA